MSDTDTPRQPAMVPSRRTVIQASMMLGLTVAILVSLFCFRVSHVKGLERQLEQLDAEYAYDCETFDRGVGKKPSPHQRTLAGLFGKAAVSDFSIVRLHDESLDDSKLSLLGQLRELRSLELQSNAATDKTLSIISQLPDLRYLSLAGNRFTIVGLLELRRAQALRSLRLDARQLTPIELAVLKHELVGVDLLQVEAEDQYDYSPTRSVSFPPAA